MTDENSWENAVIALRKDPSKEQLVKDAYFDDPIYQAAERYRLSEEWRAICRLLPNRRGTALDLGAGRGIASYALAQEGFQVTALEPDKSQIVGSQAICSLAEECNLPIEVVQEFSEKLPFPKAKFDLVFARAVLHHTTNLQAACDEVYRVLKPGGKVIAIREHVISRPEDLELFLSNHPLHHLYGGENAFLLEDYLTSIRKAEFNIEKVIPPLESVINFAPHTLQSLKQEFATKITSNISIARDLLRVALDIPGIWLAATYLLRSIDHRPGRLYSFVATRPD